MFTKPLLMYGGGGVDKVVYYIKTGVYTYNTYYKFSGYNPNPNFTESAFGESNCEILGYMQLFWVDYAGYGRIQNSEIGFKDHSYPHTINFIDYNYTYTTTENNDESLFYNAPQSLIDAMKTLDTYIYFTID